MIPKSDAIVLKSFDYRETSRIAVFFTRDYGKVSGVLKGIRKDSKKFGSTADRFSINHLVYYPSRSSDLHLIGQCDLKEFFGLIRTDYRRNLAATYAVELIDKIMQSGQSTPEIYDLTLEFLQSLNQNVDIDKAVHMFQIKILYLSGFSPHLDSCLKCQEPIQDKSRFSLHSGGLICAKCPTSDADYATISKGAASTIMHVEHNSWRECLRLGLTPAIQKELKLVLSNFLTYHFEKKVHTAKYL